MSRGHGEGQKGRPNNYKLEEEIDALSMESSLNGEGQDFHTGNEEESGIKERSGMAREGRWSMCLERGA